MKKTIALLIGMGALLYGTNALAAVGRTQGQFQVSSTGSAQYSIPIWAPPGPRGIQPNISLFYDSRAPIGPLGLGWSIAGLGEITRCNKTVAQDTTAAPVTLATSDGYCINGNRLRLTSGTYGTAGSVYQTEIADFSQITAYSSSGITGIGYFIVQGRNGLTYYYGYTDTYGNGAGSQVIANGFSPQTALTWMLSRVVDRAGNNYVIDYTNLSGALIGTAVPSKIYWTPVSAGSSSYSYTMQFNYNQYPSSNIGQSSINKYRAGTQVYNPQYLSSVEILYGTTVVKDYFLGYSPSPVTGREQLASVTECPTTTNSGSNCLSPTTISYGTPSPGLSSTPNSGPAFWYAHYDFNGDGIPDILYGDGTNYWVAFGSASGYQTPIQTGIPFNSTFRALPGNLNGGPEDGLLADNGGTWYYYTWNGTAFEGVTTGLSVDTTAQQFQLADVDGNGLPDLISLYFTPNVSFTLKIRQNTTTGSSVTFSSSVTTGYTQSGTSIWAVILNGPAYGSSGAFSKLRTYDFNGDGREDIALLVYTQSGSTNYISSYELISNGSGSSFSPLLINTQNSYSTNPFPFFVDMNDDKCTDYAYGNTLYISACNGTVAKSITVGSTIIGAMDWDGDGRTDILVANGTTVGVYLSTGGGFSSTITPTSIPYSNLYEYITLDATGGGLDDLGIYGMGSGLTYYLHNGTPDLATKFSDGFGNSVSPSYTTIATGNYTQYHDATAGYANYIGPMYVVSEAVFSDPSTTSGTYNQTFWYYGAWLNLQGRGFQSFYAKRMIDSRNGLYYFQYYERAFPYTGMDFEDDVANSADGQDAYYVRTPAVTTLSSATNEERYFPHFSNITQNQYELATAGDYLVTTTSTDYQYDNYGNATMIATTVTDEDPHSPYTGNYWTATTTNTTDISTNQGNDVAAWCLNMLVKTQVVYSSNLSGSTPVTRTKTFGLDTPTACRVTATVTEPGSAYQVYEGLTFDAFGNVATDTVTGANMLSSPASREMYLNWGPTGQFLNSLQDPSGATTSWSYTSNKALTFGVPDSMTDINSLATGYGYDAFGRKIQDQLPDHTYINYNRTACSSNCGFGNSVYQIATVHYQTNGSTIIRTDTVAYDPIDRVTQTQGPTVAGTTATVQKVYNSLGLLTQQSMPFLSGGTAYQQTYAYDALNRLLETERPVSGSGPTYCNPAVPPVSGCQGTAYTYAGRTTTVTDPKGNAQTTVKDVNGWLRRVTDALGYAVTRAYDSAGSLIGVTDSVGNALLKNVTVVYGVKPFITAATDADRGSWAFTVDSLGERTGWTDANGLQFSMTYDALSRPRTRTDPESSTAPSVFTEWNYGSAAPNLGRLTSECTAATSTTNLCTMAGSTWLYNESRYYDSLARLQYRWIVQSGNPGNDTNPATSAIGGYLYTLGYSTTTGLPSGMTYPKSTSGTGNPLNLAYGYGYGLLQTVTDTSDLPSTCGSTSTCTLWTANATNAFGEVTQETLGNGVVMNRTYDAVTSWLSKVTAGVGGGTGLLNQSYSEDKNGNVTERENNTPGIYENFYYDADNRLCAIVLGGGGSCSSSTIVYDGPGNIKNQPGVGSYTYPVAGQPRPHAVTSIAGTFNGITNPTFSYDANGNMTSRASANVTWFSFNYPATISASDVTGSEEVQFSYGPDRQRWQQIYSAPGVMETTYYVGNGIGPAPAQFEVVFNGTTNYRHYIYAGSEPIAVYSRSSAGNTMSYFLADHQGSVSVISSNSGGVDVDDSFSAFGQLRNSTTWSGVPTSVELSGLSTYTRQGYTFQTWLGQSMGLNHMNGRVQDAISGRMLSPDPHIPDPSNTQSYNRYSYVNNNPLTLTDPTGFVGDCTGYPLCDYDQYVDLATLLPDVTVTCCTQFQPNPSPFAPNLGLPNIFPALDPGYFNVPHVAEQNGGGTQNNNGAQSNNKQSPQQCRASLEPWVQAGAGAAGGSVGGFIVAGPGGAAAGFAAGGITGYVSGSLSSAGAPIWFNGAVSTSTGYVSTAFASEAFVAGGATFQSSAYGAFGGAVGVVVPGAAGAGSGAATSAIGDLATVADAGIVGLAAGLTAYIAYKALDAAANNYCGL